MIGYVCQYNYNNQIEIGTSAEEILTSLNAYSTSEKVLSTTSLFKLSTGASKLRPYFKQFESNGVFTKIIRKILVPQSAYKITLYKNDDGEYAAFWLIGFDDFTNFEADTNAEHFTKLLEEDVQSRQIIFYGAPGTGKSHGIKAKLKGVSKTNIIRTTFHPDSDYSTFVGAYKPTMKERYRYEANQRVRYPEDDDLAKAKRNDNIVERVIEYDFVPQAFVNAYTRAYQTDENVYLIIEEINRGNCAQIFGDLFQLLDRNDDGYSDYTIKADADLRVFLEKELGEDSDGIKDGELCLPPNLYIWATMNTSDQSLFPIDSAFKRRWDWEYVPISYGNTDWKINIDGNLYSWVDFQHEVNNRIYDATQSEDKKLGDYFVKAVNSVISKDMLLNKVLFYLWNDVCKDGEGDIFKIHSSDGDKDVTFSELYGTDGIEKLQDMMEYLGVKIKDCVGEEADENKEEATPEIQEWRHDFWKDLKAQYAVDGLDFKTSPQRRYCYQMGLGITGLSLMNWVNKSQNRCSVGIYIEAKQGDEYYGKLSTIKNAIDSEVGEPLLWTHEQGRYASAKLIRNYNLDDVAKRQDAIRWMAEKGKIVNDVFKSHLDVLR